MTQPRGNPPGTVSGDWLNADVIGAMRLAFAAASGLEATVIVIDKLLSYAPKSDPTALGPTRLLVQAVQETADLRLTVVEL